MTEAIIFAPARIRFTPMTYTAEYNKVHDQDISARFEVVFKANYKALHAYACTILKEDSVSEEIVQNVFYKLWERKEQFEALESPSAYLYRSVYNDCLNHIKHKKVKAAHQAYTLHTSNEADNGLAYASVQQIEGKLNIALQKLPEQCRTIFQMSRFEELKYREIADKLGLSVKTIENQMGKALRILRTELAEYLPILLFLLHL